MVDTNGVRIDELNVAVSPSLEHTVPAMKDGDTVQLTLGQVKELVLAGVSTFVKTLLDDADASAFLTTLGVSNYAKTLLDDANVGAAQTTLGLSAFVKTLMDDADASAFLTTLGVSTFVKTLLDDADAGAAQTTLGISTFIKTLLDDANVGAAQTTLGLSAFVKTLMDDADASAFLTTLGVSTFVKTLLDDTDGSAFWNSLGGAYNNAGTGYVRLPNGLIIQWGTTTQVGSSDFTLSWGISFPNAIRMAIAMPLFNAGSATETSTVTLASLGVSNCSCRPRYIATGGTVTSTSGMPIVWIAIGY